MTLSIKEFPNSIKEPFIITSKQTSNYNCIAWAFGDETKWYWPDDISFWPSGIPNEPTIQSFIELFKLQGYENCDNGNLESGYVKVAIYTKNNKPSHAAKQLSNGFWSSKLGQGNDVSHTINSMTDGFYGNIEVFMKRKIENTNF
jgi:hypothetical protein